MRILDDVPGPTWVLLMAALVLFGGGLLAIAILTDKPSADSIVALVTAVVGVFAIHIGHVSGHQQEARRTEREQTLAVLEQTQPEAVKEARKNLGLR
jgi:hypothetical protein